MFAACTAGWIVAGFASSWIVGGVLFLLMRWGGRQPDE